MLNRLNKYAPREFKDMGAHMVSGEDIDLFKWQLTREAATDEALIAELKAEIARLKQAGASGKAARDEETNFQDTGAKSAHEEESRIDGSIAGVRASVGKTSCMTTVKLAKRTNHAEFFDMDGSFAESQYKRAKKN